MEINDNLHDESENVGTSGGRTAYRGIDIFPSELTKSSDTRPQNIRASESSKSGSSTNFEKSFVQNCNNSIRIDASDKSLTNVDLNFEELASVEELLMDGNRLEILPSNLNELKNLRWLSASDNKIASLPENIVNLISLEVIKLARNKISVIPDSWLKFDRLRILDLSCNSLSEFPDCVYRGLPLLEILDLSRNMINDFSKAPLSRKLRKISIGFNPKNEKFPRWIFAEEFSNLEEILLDETLFSSFDLPVEGLPPLRTKKLSMVKSGLSDTVFEKILPSMVDLETVNLGNGLSNGDGNVFWTMPVKGFPSPEKLREIYIQAAGLPALPREINRLTNLTRLDVSRNGIDSLPEEICELTKLEFLNASGNRLYALPRSIGNMNSLKLLFLESNRLSSIPDSAERLDNLELIDLYNNEFTQFPKQLLERMKKLRAIDVDGNHFTTDNLQIGNIDYLEARNLLRSTSNIFLIRENDLKLLSESSDDEKSRHSSDGLENMLIEDDNKLSGDMNYLSDISDEENWDISEDSADEYDPTAKPRTYRSLSPFTVSSVFYYGNFCPADLHSATIKEQLAAMEGNILKNSYKRSQDVIEPGQFDDA